MTATYSGLTNQLVSASNSVDYAYRDTGMGTVPLVLLQHFRGNLDNWDPALIDALASARRVVTFDNAGVGGSSGTTPDTIGQMARCLPEEGTAARPITEWSPSPRCWLMSASTVRASGPQAHVPQCGLSAITNGSPASDN
jgi:pimeloyl-ACP methyl ester carboxylesterase